MQWTIGGTHGGDDAVMYAHVTDKRGTTETVDDGAAPNDKVECHTPNVRWIKDKGGVQEKSGLVFDHFGGAARG